MLAKLLLYLDGLAHYLLVRDHQAIGYFDRWLLAQFSLNNVHKRGLKHHHLTAGCPLRTDLTELPFYFSWVEMS